MNIVYKLNFRRYFALFLAMLFFLTFFNFSVVSDSENRPDLEIDYVDFPEEVSEDDDVNFVVRIKNSIDDETDESGNISDGTRIWTSLKVDGVLVSANYSDSGLDIGENCYINLTWTADYNQNSQRQILIEVDYMNDISESNENNNERPGIITINEKDPELGITNVIVPDALVVDNPYTITASIKNNGAKTTDDITIFFNSSADGDVETITYEESIERNDTVKLNFNWTPSKLGKQKISIEIVYADKNHDSYSSTVFVGKLDWWNESWHYRYFISLEGQGVFSKMFNFTSLLNELDVSTGSFENETIRVVQYSSDGDIVNDTIKYNFNETSEYNENTNANGELLWDVKGDESEKFFCVYFDVDINPGFRESLQENDSINVSGDVTILDSGFVEGWDFEIIEPEDGSYNFVNDTVEFVVNTESIVGNVEVFIYLNENESNNRTLVLESLDGVSWSNTTDFGKMGNWTYELECQDNAGFIRTDIENTIFVGKPDLEISDITFQTDAPSEHVYINDTVTFTAKVYCYFATVGPVNITMTVYNESSVEVYSKVKDTTFKKDKYTNISFNWDATHGGNFTFKFYVDSDDIIDEIDETNNKKEINITVDYWPDLVVTGISWKKTVIMEYEKVKFNVKVKNIGWGDAYNYDLNLFIQPSSQQTIEYKDEVYSKKISVDSGSEEVFSLFWDSAEVGKWFVAAKVFVNDTKQDANINNNGLFVTEKLVIKATEKNKPVIKDVYVDPTTRQGEVVEITADVTDDTGLEYVSIFIYDSDDDLVESGDMIRIVGDGFKYVFTNTLEVDTYTFNITSVDISINKNKASYTGSFGIIRDIVFPTIYYAGAEPMVQLKGETTRIICIVEDNVGIEDVEVFITTPDGRIIAESLQKKSDKYIYENIYDDFGNYSYYILVTDKAGNVKTTGNLNFYISKDVEDTDNDKMPDWWEERYGFDPLDPADGNKDYDDDGVKNYEEYLGGTNPHKNIMIQNIAYRVRSNVWYVIVSTAMFILLLIIYFVFRKRR